MRQAKIQYKCRNCGAVFEDDLFVTEEMANIVLAAIVELKQLPTVGCTTPPYFPSIYSIHVCKETDDEVQKGIAEVIGYRIQKEGV